MHERTPVPDRGPWTVMPDGSGAVFLSSEDFNHDVLLHIKGDFASPEDRQQYASYLADVLTRGCYRKRASLELEDTGALLAEIDRAKASPVRECLERAADEIARLRTALEESTAALERLQVSAHFLNRQAAAASLSPFAQQLLQALGPAGPG